MVHMLLLGAGGSAPFGIPTMDGFVRKLTDGVTGDEKDFLTLAKESIELARSYVGISFAYDLESLMAVLEGVAGERASLPTMAFVCHLADSGLVPKPSIEEVRKKFKRIAKDLLIRVRKLVFRECILPIRKGREKETIGEDLDRLYGPLFLLLTGQIDNLPTDDVRWVFTTNWDTCLEEWMKSRNFPLTDGTRRNEQGELVLNVRSGWGQDSAHEFKIVPLHGSTSWIRKERFLVGGRSEIIMKVDPKLIKEEVAEHLFLIYPLEAIGYESAAQSPYLDMLHMFREKMMTEGCVYVVGYSFRDPTVNSVFEQVLRERTGDWIPLEGNSKERTKIAAERKPKFMIIALDSSPSRVLENVRDFHNLYRAIIPIEVTLPPITSEKFEEEYASALLKVERHLSELFHYPTTTAETKLREISNRWKIPFPEDSWTGSIQI